MPTRTDHPAATPLSVHDSQAVSARSAATALLPCDTLQLALFSGKGGVGKTTVSCGFARRWARQFPQERIVLISTDPAHSLGDVLDQSVTDTPSPMVDLPNVQVRSLDAERLLQRFKDRYGSTLETLVERGSFVEGEDLSPIWDLSWPGLDELMGILEIQRLLQEQDADRVVVDMAPSGHALNLLGLMDFLDNFLGALDLFQAKHREISQRFTGQYTEDSTDAGLAAMHRDLMAGRQLLQDGDRTACLVMAIAEPMSLLESQRFMAALQDLKIQVGGIVVNRIGVSPPIAPQSKTQALAAKTPDVKTPDVKTPDVKTPKPQGVDATVDESGIHREQQTMLQKFLALDPTIPVMQLPKQAHEPIGGPALDQLMTALTPVVAMAESADGDASTPVQWPDKLAPGFEDFMDAGRQLLVVGGKGGVGKTTVSAAIAWGMAQRHGDRNVRIISIDPAHSLGDALGLTLGHTPHAVTSNLSAQEINADQLLDQFRQDYLWELADMMSGDSGDGAIQLAYGPQAWRQIVAQALPGIDEMLALLTVMELLESGDQDLIVLDTAPTGHLLRFLAMPTALGDWLAWIFKLWLKYQDSVGRVEFMGRLRTLRKRVMAAQKTLQDPSHTEFIGVVQAQRAILAEAERLTHSLTDLSVCQRYLVHNRCELGCPIDPQRFPHQTIVRLPQLPRAIAPQAQIQGAAGLLF